MHARLRRLPAERHRSSIDARSQPERHRANRVEPSRAAAGVDSADGGRNLPRVVDVIRVADEPAGLGPVHECGQVVHRAVPEERPCEPGTPRRRQGRFADHLASVVDPERVAEVPAQIPEDVKTAGGPYQCAPRKTKLVRTGR
jgi:hypothetical protein